MYAWIYVYIYNELHYIDALVQDFSISIANILEILQSCTKPSICPGGENLDSVVNPTSCSGHRFK